MIFKTIILNGVKYELTKYNFQYGKNVYWTDKNGIVTNENILSQLNKLL